MTMPNERNDDFVNVSFPFAICWLHIGRFALTSTERQLPGRQFPCLQPFRPPSKQSHVGLAKQFLDLQLQRPFGRAQRGRREW